MYDTHYIFAYWYDRTLSSVSLACVTADGDELDKDSDDYSDFLDEVFSAIVHNPDQSDIEETADVSDETEPDDKDESVEEVSNEQEEAIQQENSDSSEETALIVATEEYIYYDALSDYSIILNYTSDSEGTFVLHMEETDEETWATTSADYDGTFIQDITGQGNADGWLYISVPEEMLYYGIYYVDDHYEFELYDSDDAYFITLYEKEWSSQHAG
jgi:hypothetical protein